MKVIFKHTASLCDYEGELIIDFDPASKEVKISLPDNEKTIEIKKFKSYKKALTYFQKCIGLCVLGRWACTNVVKIEY